MLGGSEVPQEFILDRLWRAARFTKSYADQSTDESEEDNFEDGLDFEDGDESIEGIRRRLSDEAVVNRVGEALNQTLEVDRQAEPRDHFSPVQVRFPVNAPALRPPAVEDESESENTMPEVDFDLENKEDGDKAQENARHIKIDFEPNNVRFWFSQLEAEMLLANIGTQWLKKTVLQRNLPNKQKEDVQAYLELPRTQAGANIYYDIKQEIIRIYAPKPQTAYKRALGRTMVGLPSQLGHQIVNDVCKKPVKLVGCCCSAAVLAIWEMKLPIEVRAHISNKEFTATTYKEVFEAADKVHQSAQSVSVAAVGLDETLPAFSQQNQPQPQVAAVHRGGQRGGGRGRGNRGGGSGSGRGGGQTGQNQSGQSQSRGGQSGRGGRGQARGPRHSSNPPESCCDHHYKHGADSWFCVAPLTCPWVNKCSPRP